MNAPNWTMRARDLELGVRYFIDSQQGLCVAKDISSNF